jgi:hypothetical protein
MGLGSCAAVARTARPEASAPITISAQSAVVGLRRRVTRVRYRMRAATRDHLARCDNDCDPCARPGSRGPAATSTECHRAARTRRAHKSCASRPARGRLPSEPSHGAIGVRALQLRKQTPSLRTLLRTLPPESPHAFLAGRCGDCARPRHKTIDAWRCCDSDSLFCGKHHNPLRPRFFARVGMRRPTDMAPPAWRA